MSKKAMTIIIAILALLVVGLIVFIAFDKGKQAGREEADSKKTTTAATTAATTEATTEAASDTDSQVKTTTTNSTGVKYACYAKLSETGNWEDGSYTFYQYEVELHNDSSEDLTDWEVRISGFDNAEIADKWNATYEIKDDGTLYCTAVDYNGTLAAKSMTSFGFQLKYKSGEETEDEKEAVVYIDGEQYLVEKEEPTTQSAEGKEEIKKDKVESEEGTPVEVHGKLSIDGTDIVDQNGDKFQLKGVSTHGLAWFPDYVNKDSFQTFRDDWDANLIRLAMYTAESGGYCSDGNKDNLKALVDDGVDYATELGMYVIIDWHILSDNNPQTNEDEAISFFDEMSAKYADYDNVLYEICNEPNGSTTWSDVKAYAEDVIPVIRANDDDAIIIVGTPTWSQDVDQAAADPITGYDNIAYTVHFYAATHKENIRDKVKTAHDSGLCVFISEFSICDASGNGGIDYDSADDWFEMIDDYNISYAGWNISNKAETSAFIDPSCTKTSGWTDDEYTDTGIWLKNKMSE